MSEQKIHTRYYVADACPGLAECLRDRQDVHTAASALARQLGYEDGAFYSDDHIDGTHVVGFRNAFPLAPGLRVSRSKRTNGLAVPDLRTSIGRALRKRMEALVKPNSWMLGGYLGIGNEMIFENERQCTSGVSHRRVGEVDVIIVRDTDEERLASRVPEGCRQVSYADFLRMQADAEDAKSSEASKP